MTTFLISIIIILIGIILYLNNKNKRGIHLNIEDDPEELIDEQSEFVNENPQKLNKNKAIRIINQYLESDELSNYNTSFSTINKAVPLWWFNIAPEKFEEELHLILARKNNFIWIKLPKGSVSKPKRKFRFRDDKGLIEIKISTQPDYNLLRDESSGGIGFGFQQYVQKEFNF